MKSTIILILAIGLTGGLALAQYGASSQDKAAAAFRRFPLRRGGGRAGTGRAQPGAPGRTAGDATGPACGGSVLRWCQNPFPMEGRSPPGAKAPGMLPDVTRCYRRGKAQAIERRQVPSRQPTRVTR